VVLESHEGWCFGFMHGVERASERWVKLDKNGEALLSPIAQLALLESEEEPEMDEDEYNMWVELIPGAVLGLRDYFTSH